MFRPLHSVPAGHDGASVTRPDRFHARPPSMENPLALVLPFMHVKPAAAEHTPAHHVDAVVDANVPAGHNDGDVAPEMLT